MRLLTFLFLAATAIAQTTQTSHTTENLRGVSAPTSKIAWASGTHGTYLRTTDGGGAWSPAQVPGAEALDFRDVEAFSADLAYLLAAGPGEQSRIYKTTNAGKIWTLQFNNKNPKGFFDCMAFWNPNHGIAVGDPVADEQGQLKFEVITTKDGGQHWTPIAPENLPSAIAGEGGFAASGTCIAVHGKKNAWFVTGGKAARVFRSTNAGKTWSVVETPIVHGADSTGIFSIAFRDRRHGVIAGGDYQHPEQSGANLAITNDGGLTWALAPISPQWYFSAIAFVPACVAADALVRPQKSIFALGTAHAACAHETYTKWQENWNFNLNALSVSPSGDIFAVGPKGLIVHFP